MLSLTFDIIPHMLTFVNTFFKNFLIFSCNFLHFCYIIGRYHYTKGIYEVKQNEKKTATIKEVALRAGVSVMTVSRVINHSNLVNDETKKKVQEAIDALRYKPNRIAKSLVSGKSNIIGILSSNMYNMAYTDAIDTIEEIAYKHGYMIFNANVNEYASAIAAVDNFVELQVDGIIVLPLEMKMSHETDYRVSMEKIDKFIDYYERTSKASNIPTVTISQKMKDIPDIALDFKTLAQKALDYLLEQGYKDISLVTSMIDDGFWLEKQQIYIDTMKKHGLEEYISIYRGGPVALEGGRSATEELLQTHIPEAIFCANDALAIGTLQAIHKAGLRIPQDVAVIGNDDIYFSQLTSPRLTTVSLNMRKAGKAAIRAMFHILKGEELPQNVVVPTTLVIREST